MAPIAATDATTTEAKTAWGFQPPFMTVAPTVTSSACSSVTMPAVVIQLSIPQTYFMTRQEQAAVDRALLR